MRFIVAAVLTGMAIAVLSALPVLAVVPLAVSGYEILGIDNTAERRIGFPGGDVNATIGFGATPAAPTTGPAPWSLAPTNPATPTGIFGEGGEGMPGLKELGDASEATGNPRGTLIMIVAFLLALLAGFAVYGATHNARMGQRGSLLLQSLTSLMVMVFFVVGGGGVIPGWVLIPFGVEALFMLITRNPQHSST